MNQPTFPKPAPCPVQPENIPAEMKARPQWVCWRWTWKPPSNNANGKWDKPPYDARTGQHARSNDSVTWATFDEAWAAYCDPANNYSGIGYMFSGEPGDFVGVDLDDCRDPQSGEIRVWTPEQRACKQWMESVPEPQGVIEALATYGEVSPSGKGVKLIVRGDLSSGIKHGDIEMYRSGRYFTITGNRLPSCPHTINECELLEYLRRYFSAKEEKKGRASCNSIRPKFSASSSKTTSSALPTVEQLIAACNNAANGDKFRKLFDGDLSGYSSPSEADAALCGIIAFWSSGEANLIDQLFRQSKLIRDKWDEVHDSEGRTYGEMTVDAALELVSEFYDWSQSLPAAQVVCGLTLVTRSVRRTAAKLSVQIEIQESGKPINLIRLTDSAASRKSAVKAIAARISDEPLAASKVDAALGLILVDAARPQEQGTKPDLKEIHQILADYVPGELDLQYATDGGRAFSAKLGRVISRSQFVERFTSETVLTLASTGLDAPRDDNDLILRPQLISIVERELKVLWGELVSRLGCIEDVELAEDSHAAVAYRQAILSLWMRPASMGIHKTAIQKGPSVQLATRNSLALRVRKLLEEGIESEKWHVIQPGFEAFVRIEQRASPGEFKRTLAMRFELAQQVGSTIPDTTNQRVLKKLGVKFGAVVGKAATFAQRIPDRMTGGGRLAVLTDKLTDEILACPVEVLDDGSDDDDAGDSAKAGSDAGGVPPVTAESPKQQ